MEFHFQPLLSHLLGVEKIVLRGVTLSDNNHFTAVLCMPNGWTHHDGMDNPKFTFYDLERTTEACSGRVPALAMFEIID